MTSRVASFSPQRFGEVFELPSERGGLELVLRPAPAGGAVESLPDPFVRLSDPGGVAAVVVARAVRAGAAGRLVGVLVRSDSAWAERSAAAADGWFQELAREWQALILEPGRNLLSALPPLWYCKRRQLLFVPPCPACGEPLAECRDDTLLQAVGLGSRSSTPHRWVYCPSCVGRDGGSRFYSPTGEPAGHPQVDDRWTLVADFARQVEAGGGNPHFPCPGCSFSHTCFPPEAGGGAGEARTLLTPLSFYGGEACTIPLLPLPFDAAGEVLGGRAPAEVRQPWDETSPTGQRSRPVFWFAEEREQRLPLEILLLKLTVFEQLCAELETFHRTLGRPHLNLNPGTVRVALGSGAGAAPAGWCSQVGVVGLEGARPAADATGEEACAWQPPLRADLAYSHPGVAAWRGEGGWQPARFAVRMVVDDGEGCVVEGVLETERLRPGETGPADTVQVELGQTLGFRSELRFACAVRGGDGGGVALRSAPVHLEPTDRDRLKSLRALPQVEVRFTVARRYGVECDLFSLGMLWFRALIVNRSQGMDEVSHRVRLLAGELERRVGAGEAAATELLAGELGRCLADPLLEARQVAWDPLPLGGEPIPNPLWRQVVELGFRLLTAIPGFSFLPAGGARATVDGAAVGRARAALGEVLGQVRQALRDWQPEPVTEVRAVLAEVIDDPQWLDRVLGGQVGPMSEVQPPTAAAAAERGLEETVVLQRDQLEAALETARVAASVSVTPEEPAARPRLETTVILRPGQRGTDPGAQPAAPPRPAVPPEPESSVSGLDTTVILRRPGRANPDPAPAPTEAPTAPEPAGEALEKTIILRRNRPEGGG